MRSSTQMWINAIGRVLRNPASAKLFTRAGWRRVRYVMRPPRHGKMDQSAPIGVREYRSYQDYVRHQQSKLALLDLTEYDRSVRAGLAERLSTHGPWSGHSVLCLGARLGGEVRAFHDVGAFAVGVDLNPGEANSWVLHGDFHGLVFPDCSVDAVYSNSLDHALDVCAVLAEVARVLKPAGTLLIDAQEGAAGRPFDDWATTSWRAISDLERVVAAAGFDCVRRSPITTPWPGESLCFIRPAPAGSAAVDRAASVS